MQVLKGVIILFFLVIISRALHAQTIRIATYQYADNDRIKNIQPFADHIKHKLGYNVSVKSYPTVHAFIKGIQDNETDISLINTLGYLLLESSGKPYPMYPVAALEVMEEAQNNYKTALVVSRKLAISRFSDLKDHASSLRLALVSEGSTSGNLVPRLALNGVGISVPEEAFDTFYYAGTHHSALEAVLNNRADVAAMGYTEYEKYLQQDSLNSAGITLLWLSPEIPLGPVLFNKRFNDKTRQELLKALLDLQLQNSAALDSIKAGWSEARQTTFFTPIKHSHYDAIRRMASDNGELQRILKRFVR